MLSPQMQKLQKLDGRPVPNRPGELRLFAGFRNEEQKLPYFLEHHRRLGIERFFLIDNESTDRSNDYLARQPDCHYFHASGSHFAENVTPPNWTNALLGTFGHGHWCLTLDVDELFVYPRYEHLGLRSLCAILDRQGAEVVYALMIDMYNDGPVNSARYRVGQPFTHTCSHLDPEPGWTIDVNRFPPVQAFGGVRERVFWRGRFRKSFPPCISKVPLVKWRRGMRYLSAQHQHTGGRLSGVHGALLHFKFLTDFHKTTAQSLDANQNVVEKGLSERVAYIEALESDPLLTLMNDRSVKFKNSSQLTKLGWMRETLAFEQDVKRTATAKKAPGSLPS